MTRPIPQLTPLPIILASSSPRRQQLLELANVQFTTLIVDIDEAQHPDELPIAYIKRMVQQKAFAAANQTYLNNQNNTVNAVDSIDGDNGIVTLSGDHEPKTNNKTNNKNKTHCLVITADTIGVLPDTNQALVKPIDKQDAFAMWRRLSGRTHSIWTAVQVSMVNLADGKIEYCTQLVEKTEVSFAALNERQMELYWGSGEPIDKAGGYAIQGGAAAWVTSIRGSYTNVVGLPLAQTLEAIQEMQSRYTKT